MSEIKKAQQAKQVIIDEIKEKLSRAKSAVVIDYMGITVEQAVAFIQFCKVYKDLLSIDTILKNPDVDPPADLATLWATVIHLINKTNAQNFPKLVKFIDKLPATFQIIYLRSLKKLQKDLLMLPEFTVCTQKLGDFCFGD